MITLAENTQIDSDFLVTRAYQTRYGFAYKLTDGENVYSFNSDEQFAVGESIHIKTSFENAAENKLWTAPVKRYSSEEQQTILKSIEQKAMEAAKISDVQLLLSDQITSAMNGKFKKTARYLLAAQKLGRYVMLKFHGDADGISGAFAITSFLKCFTVQQNAAVYSAKDAIRDLSSLHHEYRPLMVIVDFGAGEESEEGMNLLKAAGIEIVIIDHHPPSPNISKYTSIFLSPWVVNANEDVSKYPAGYLCCEIARLCNTSFDSSFNAQVACAGDKSTIIEVSDEARNRAFVLDYLAINSGFGNNLDFYRSVVSNKELSASILAQAKEKINTISEKARKTMKEYDFRGLFVNIIELDRLIKESEFPSRGKVTTYIYESLPQDVPRLVIGHGEKTIILRLNQLAVDRGIAGDALIDMVKQIMPDFIDSGGGHKKAAAIRVKEGFVSSVIEEMLKILKTR